MKNKYTKMLSILKINVHIYILNKNTLKLYLVYLKSAKLEQLILCLMQFNCAQIVLKCN